ncbi:MAG: hypothetical protein IPK01_12150 [Acidobacteria bacterium]|nr:hypothetical protein [Acidobacteriota bacterium]
MTSFDLAIIYLACGAPLSMHYFFAASGKPKLYFAMRIVLVALFWPIAAFSLIMSLRRPIAGANRSGGGEIERKLDSLRVEIEHSAFTDDTAASVFEFRELFARYTGLIQASTAKAEHASANELFLLSGHKNAELATRCLDRKASNQLKVHANASREDFVESIAAMTIAADGVLVRSASAVAELVGDSRTAEMLLKLALVHDQTDLRSIPADTLDSAERLHTAIG